MYNRYIPTPQGTYRREIVHAKERPDNPPSPVKQTSTVCSSAPTASRTPVLTQGLKLDMQDILVLAVLLLIFLNEDGGDNLPLLITMAAFILLQ